MADNLNPTHAQIVEFLTNHIISEMTQYLMDDYGYTLEKALDVIYTSHVLELLQIEEGELYIQSPAYVYELLLKEKGLYPVFTPSMPEMVAEE